MYTKTITYKDFKGNEKTEILNFNLSKREILMLQGSVEGGFDKAIEKIQKDQDMYKMYALFDKLIQAAYGKVSEDGSRFIKNPEISADFVSSAAYDKLFDELTANPELIKDFFIGIVPEEARGSIAAEFQKLNEAE